MNFINKSVYAIIVVIMLQSIPNAETVSFNGFSNEYWLTKELLSTYTDSKWGYTMEIMQETESDYNDGNQMGVLKDELQMEIQGLGENNALYSTAESWYKDKISWFNIDEFFSSAPTGFFTDFKKIRPKFTLNNFTPYSLPEPGTISLVLIGLLGMTGMALIKKRKYK